MYAAEKMFKSLTCEELYLTLDGFVDNDYYIEDFMQSKMSQDFLYVLELYDLIFIASDNRALLTRKGEKLHQRLNVMLI